MKDLMQKFGLITNKFLTTVFLLFVGSLFFPMRKVFLSMEAYQTGAYSDFTSFSLYLSDILLFLTLITLFVSRGRILKSLKNQLKVLFLNHLGIGILIFWLILGLILHFKLFSSLNWYFLAKWLELFVSYGTIRFMFRTIDIKGLFISFFGILAGFQSIIALFQFFNQKSLGNLFHRLGEQLLNPEILGVAKIVSGGTKLIRGYGTFPHPNLLSAFLVTGIFFSIYQLLHAFTRKSKIFWGFLVLLNILGLTVTFSRASFLALIVGMIIFFGYLLLKRSSKNLQMGMAIGVIVGSVSLAALIFHPYLLTRATASDHSSIERIFYSKIGLQIIKDKPFFGTGVGESVLHMQQYAGTHLWPWEIQPIHNYFLLAAAELGIIGALILIWIFLSHLWRLIRKLRHPDSHATYYLLLTTIFCSFLVLMQFDHYFYTLQQTQLLLWIILGMIAAEIQSN